MTNLTNSLIEQVRGEIGDVGPDFLIPRDQLQRMYERAEGEYEPLLVYALRWMVGYYARAVTSKGQDERTYNNKLWEHYKEMLTSAENQAGMSGGKIMVGSVSLNQNWTCDDLTSPLSDAEWCY